MNAATFLRHLIETVPYAIQIILTDNGVPFTDRKPVGSFPADIFDRVCREHDIEHRLTTVNHPWTNGQVERMNRPLMEATGKRYRYSSHDPLRGRRRTFVDADYFARRLKTLKGLAPFQYIVNCGTEKPKRFKRSPNHRCPGRNS